MKYQKELHETIPTARSMASDHFVEQENAIPSPNQTESDDSRSHTITQQASEEVNQENV